MAISFNSVVGFAPMISGSCIRCSVPRKLQVSSPAIALSARQLKRPKHGQLRLFVAESDSIATNMDTDGSGNSENSVPPSDAENNKNLPTPSPSTKPEPSTKKMPLTVREKLRAARVLSRYNETKATVSKAGMGSRLLDALKESDKGKKGLPAAPTNLFDDSKRGMPKQGLTFDFPGGFDLFLIIFSFVFISTVMFATTFIVWKVGAIHFNEY